MAAPPTLKLNRAHPLAQGLLFLAYPGNSNRDVLLNMPEQINGTVTKDVGNGQRRMVTASGTASGIAYERHPGFGSLGRQFTIVAWGQWAASGFGGDVVSLVSGATNVSPFQLCLFVNGPSASPANSLAIQYPGTSTIPVFVNSAAGTYTTTERPGLVAVTRDVATCYFYKEGRLVSSAAITNEDNHATFLAATNAKVAVQNVFGSWDEGLLGSTTMAAIWNRPLNENELLQLQRDPYVLVRRNPASRLIVPLLAGVLAGNVDAAATVSGTLTVTSVLAGNVNASATLSGTLTVTSVLAGGVTGSATLSGTITVPGALAGNVNASATVSGTLTVTSVLAGGVTGSATLSGTITVPLTAQSSADVVTALLGAFTGTSLQGASLATSLGGASVSTEVTV